MVLINKDDRLYWYWIYMRRIVTLHRSIATTRHGMQQITQNSGSYGLRHHFYRCSSSEQCWYTSILSSWLIMGHYPRLFVILTELDTEWRPIVRLWVSPKWKVSVPTKVATSLISMQCVWAMVVCFYTITTKCNGALNTFDCHINSVRCEMVVALLLVPSVQIAPRQPGKLIVASLSSVQFVWAVAMCFYTINTKQNELRNAANCHTSCVRH